LALKTNHTIVSLNGAWSFQQAKAGAAWLPATVPGTVHTDLMKAGKLADPFVGQNEADVAWVENADWIYRRRFDCPAALLGAGRVRLVAEGLDTYATLWLNGKKLGSTQNMFVEQVFELKNLKPKGNELLIRFDSATQHLLALVKKHGPIPAIGDEPRSYGRKAQYSFGWDWGPRLATAGIFAPIYLEAVPDLAISDMHVTTSVATAKEARGHYNIEIDARVAATLPLSAHLGGWSWSGTVKLKKGLNKLKLAWKIPNPKLWWPRGYGDAHLYQAEVVLASGELARCEVGLRVITLERKKDKAGESFGFAVNGVPVYAKGANWIPADSFLGRVTDERIEGLVAQARDANMTMLRIWGGGLYENETFYNACDREGLLVWQDFPFACNEVPELPWFVKLVKDEAALALKRLRRHASLALWCGNNENQMSRHDGWYRGRETKHWGDLYYSKVLPALCKALDPTTPYWPGSPFGGKDPNSQSHGDRHHWLVWAQYKDYPQYRDDHGRFVSEFGFAGLPNRALLKKAIPAGERWVQSRTMQFHDKVETGAAYPRIAYYIMKHLPMAPGLDRFRYLSQVNQAEALCLGIEHWRRSKPHNQGALYWQLNDCWPVTSWAVLDGEDTPKLAYFRTRHAFDDVLLSSVEAAPKYLLEKVGKLPLRAEQEDGRCEAWLTLDGTRPFKGTLKVERWNVNGKQATLASKTVSLAANKSALLWSRQRQACGIKDGTREFLVFTLKGREGLERRSVLYFERPKRMNLPPSGLVVGARGKDDHVEVAVRAGKLALSVELHAPVPGRFSDNGFDLLPGETRVLKFVPEKIQTIKGPWQALTLNQMQVFARQQ
jgi:beta-mannosidase